MTEICVFFTSASALVIYVSKLPLGACSIRLNDLIHTAGEGLTLQLFSVFMSRVLLEYAYFLCNMYGVYLFHICLLSF